MSLKLPLVRLGNVSDRSILTALAGLCLIASTTLQKARADDAPSITITSPAPFGRGGETPRGPIEGMAKGSNLSDLKVVIYTLTDQWYVNPTIDEPFTEIARDGSWHANITLGHTYAAMLVKPGYKPEPTLAALPKVGGDVVALVQARARPRAIEFSGLEWTVKASSAPVGPGPNMFSDDKDNVFVDDKGRLHMRITRSGSQWDCAEVISKKSFGYGTYQFELETNFDTLDPNVILGLFTWSNEPAFHHREIDVEIARWGDPKNENTQFVVQPYTNAGNIVRFELPRGLNASTHRFTWKADRVDFESRSGGDAEDATKDAKVLIRRQTFDHDVPRAGGENARINLWLMDGKPPRQAREVEVIVRRFTFSPLPSR
jgi:hypothetical protein